MTPSHRQRVNQRVRPPSLTWVFAKVSSLCGFIIIPAPQYGRVPIAYRGRLFIPTNTHHTADSSNNLQTTERWLLRKPKRYSPRAVDSPSFTSDIPGPIGTKFLPSFATRARSTWSLAICELRLRSFVMKMCKESITSSANPPTLPLPPGHRCTRRIIFSWHYVPTGTESASQVVVHVSISNERFLCQSCHFCPGRSW